MRSYPGYTPPKFVRVLNKAALITLLVAKFVLGVAALVVTTYILARG